MRRTLILELGAMVCALGVVAGCSARSDSPRAIDSLVLVEAGRVRQTWDLYLRIAEQKGVDHTMAERMSHLFDKAGAIHMDLAVGYGTARLPATEKLRLVDELAAERRAINEALCDLILSDAE
jgi:hypothetical protein